MALPPVLVPRSLQEKREEKRGEIAMILVWLLVGLSSFSVLLVSVSKFVGVEIVAIKDILTVLMPSIVALVGTVTGFYFGGNSTRR